MTATMAQLVYPVNQLAAITAIGPNLFQTPVIHFQAQQQIFRTRWVLNIRRMHAHFEQQAERISQNMPFSARYLLGCIVAARPPFSVVLTD